jgi:hypothetical protein
MYRPEVLADPNYAANEEIEPFDSDSYLEELDQDRKYSEYLEGKAEAYARDYPEDF